MLKGLNKPGAVSKPGPGLLKLAELFRKAAGPLQGYFYIFKKIYVLLFHLISWSSSPAQQGPDSSAFQLQVGAPRLP